MKIHALLSWYDESATWLASLVASIAPLCDHLIAVDGSYQLYPGGRRASDPGQAEAIQTAAYAAGIGCTIHTPDARWFGNEVEKRAFMFRLGLAVAEPGEDWFLVIDGDELVTHPVPADKVRRELEQTDLDVAEVTLWQRMDPHTSDTLADITRLATIPRESTQPFRALFRALPGLTVEGLHYVYTAVKDGRRVYLWHPPDTKAVQVEPALDLTADVCLEHRNSCRDRARAESSREYYSRRERAGIEYAVRHGEAVTDGG